LAYTLSNGLRDREYSKFTEIQPGSKTAINVSPETIKTYTFPTSSITSSTGAGSGLFSTYTTEQLNGTLKVIAIGSNNWEATGSLYLKHSGLGFSIDVWSMQSGTATECLENAPIAFIPRGIMRTTENVLMSGTLAAGMLGDIPLYGTYQLIGSGLGAGKSGLGVTLVYE
jgi:hypothetical protein